MNLTVREEAEDDALTAALWYESRREGLGIQFRNRLAAVYESIQSNPHQFGTITHRVEMEQIMSSSELLNAVLQLPPKDRQELVYSAWKSLDAEAVSEFEDLESSAFAEEIEHRLDEAANNRRSLCDGEEVLREARKLVGQKSC